MNSFHFFKKFRDDSITFVFKPRLCSREEGRSGCKVSNYLKAGNIGGH